jgi:hypothetical protein
MALHTWFLQIIHIELKPVSDGGKDIINILISIRDFSDEIASNFLECFFCGFVEQCEGYWDVGYILDHLNIFHKAFLCSLDEFGDDLVESFCEEFSCNEFLPVA